MEMLHTISPAPNKSNILRSVLPLVGIVIAVICSLVSLNEIHSAEREEAGTSRLMETPKLVNTDLVVKAASTILSFTDRIN